MVSPMAAIIDNSIDNCRADNNRINNSRADNNRIDNIRNQLGFHFWQVLWSQGTFVPSKFSGRRGSYAKIIVGFLNQEVKESELDWRAASILSSVLQSVEGFQFHFKWCRRNVNEAADQVAKRARPFLQASTWLESSIPSFIF